MSIEFIPKQDQSLNFCVFVSGKKVSCIIRRLSAPILRYGFSYYARQ